MAKPPSIASLVRTAAISEHAFVTTMTDILKTEDPERIIEIFGRLNVPKLFTEAVDQPAFDELDLDIHGFDHEIEIASGFNTYIDRHMRKLKWHTTHASDESVEAVRGIYSVTTTIAALRVARVVALLSTKDTFTAEEWGQSRELVNRAYRDFRELTKLLVNRWMPAAVEVVEASLLFEGAQGLPAIIRKRAQRFLALRDKLESRRMEIAVQPEGYPPVKPPRYFGGDLMEDGAWKIYWGEVGALADNLDQTLEV
jgi:hypothetical protein